MTVDDDAGPWELELSELTADPRRRARILALQALYEEDTTEHPAKGVVERLAEEIRESAGLRAFACELVAGVRANRPAIDAIIAEVAPQFPVTEVAVIDRNVLRLAIYEVLFDSKTPVRAAVNEAVELAKTFGSDSSARFVNGVLGTVAARATR